MATQLKLFTKVYIFMRYLLDVAVNLYQFLLAIQPGLWVHRGLTYQTVTNKEEEGGVHFADLSQQESQRFSGNRQWGVGQGEKNLDMNEKESRWIEGQGSIRSSQSGFQSRRVAVGTPDSQIEDEEEEEEEGVEISGFKRCRSFAQNLCDIPLGTSVVIPGKLFLGGQLSVSAETALAKLAKFNVGVVVNVTEDFEWECVDGVVSVRYSVRDVEEEGQRLFEYFEEFFQLVKQWNIKGKAVLVHCRYGVSRSATLVLAYLMRSRKWSLMQAQDYLSGQRPCINPNAGFEYHLWQYESMLRGGGPHINVNQDTRRISKSQTRSGQIKRWCQTSVQEFLQKQSVQIPDKYVLGKTLFVGLDYMLQKGGRQGCVEQQWYMALMQEAIQKAALEDEQSAYFRNFFLTSILSPEQLNNWITDIPRTTNLIAEVLVATPLTNEIQQALFSDLRHFLQEQQLLQGDFSQEFEQQRFGTDIALTKKVLDMVANSFIPDMDLNFYD